MTKASTVYFIDLRGRSAGQNKSSKIKRLLEQPEFASRITADDLTAVKLHFGEKGNDAFIKPIFVRAVIEVLKELGAKPYLTDTNTLYKGSRSNAVDHLETALANGFSYTTVQAPLIIADGLRSRNTRRVTIDKQHFESVNLSKDILDADSMVVLTHFKGHEMAGFGGAIKNLAMGVAPIGGKMEQHSTRPFVQEATCIGCGTCMRICPADSITINQKKASIDSVRCIGCGECITVCPKDSVALNWNTELPEFIERMTEYAYGAVQGKTEKTLYLNFLLQISPDCDCYPFSDAPIVPDIGILASTDPVAIDQASFDLVNAQPGFQDTQMQSGHQPGEDKFRGTHPYVDGNLQLRYGEHIGLGSTQYKLEKI